MVDRLQAAQAGELPRWYLWSLFVGPIGGAIFGGAVAYLVADLQIAQAKQTECARLVLAASQTAEGLSKVAALRYLKESGTDSCGAKPWATAILQTGHIFERPTIGEYHLDGLTNPKKTADRFCELQGYRSADKPIAQSGEAKAMVSFSDSESDLAFVQANPNGHLIAWVRCHD